MSPGNEMSPDNKLSPGHGGLSPVWTSHYCDLIAVYGHCQQ